MASPASINKHPVYPMLVALPIGLWIFVLVCNVVRAAGGVQNPVGRPSQRIVSPLLSSARSSLPCRA